MHHIKGGVRLFEYMKHGDSYDEENEAFKRLKKVLDDEANLGEVAENSEIVCAKFDVSSHNFTKVPTSVFKWLSSILPLLARLFKKGL